MEKVLKRIEVTVGGKTLTCEEGLSLGELFATAGIKEAVAARVDGRLVDLQEPLKEGCRVEPVFLDSPEGLEIYRHSTAHVMAQAVKDLYRDVRLGIGPAIEEGFYYDFDTPHRFTPEDLPEIEKRMKEIIEEDRPFKRVVMKREEAVRLFQGLGEVYKVELLEEMDEEEVSIYRQDGFVDLCRGPHLPSTGWIRAFKLLKIAGAYWKGDERNRMLQRIYGTSFPDEGALEAYLEHLEEARKRDHRRLGRELDLFSIEEGIGPGLVLWHPKGALVRSIIEDFWRREHSRHGYQLVYTPHVALSDLWKRSGHWDFYRENLFPPMDIEGREYIVKPMNCPFHIHIYKSRLRSYRDLPIRYAELGTVYRYERSGVLHGLLRVRGFTQDDAHIFCRPDQIEEEIKGVLEFVVYILRAFGFDEFDIYLSTRPEKFVGTLDNWERATNALASALKAMGLPYQIDPGEGVFYGPKIDIKIKDSLGRSWQCSTIQVDFNLPERFGVEFVDRDNTHKQAIMIHRALLGSMERFMGCLIEHYEGIFPLWLAPVQVRVLTITDRVVDYGKEVLQDLLKNDIRAELDDRNEKLGLKIREAEIAKVPYVVVLGDREKEGRTLSVRSKRRGNLGSMDLRALVDLLKGEIEGKVSGLRSEEEVKK